MNKRQRDIERYLKGEMSASERHALEKAALNDPFLSDALEGAEHAGVEAFSFDLKELQGSIYSRTKQRHRPRTISMWNWSLGIAAGLLLVAVSGVFIIGKVSETQRKQEMAMLVDQSEDELRMIRESGAVDTMTIILPERYERVIARPSSRSRTGRILTHQRIEAIAQNEVISTSGPQREVEVNLSEEPVIARAEALDTVVSRTESAMATEEKAKNADVAGDDVQKTKAKEEVPSGGPRRIASGAKKIKGKVTWAEDGSGLPGVNVVVKGTNEGTVTDAMGVYEISVPDKGTELVFSFIGLTSQEVSTSDESTIDVKMTSDYSQLSEVVVTGYGVSTESDNTSLKFAEPQGGRKAFKNYLEKQMQYPKQALDNKIEGKVTVQFTVEINGQVGDFEILKGIGYGCDDEVIRLIKQGPAWEPTKKGNQPVTDKVKVRLKFDIPD
jgi:TonB family protein